MTRFLLEPLPQKNKTKDSDLERTPIIQQKIIHVDMDCFYAAIEMRDNKKLVDKPIAVGGTPDKRGVICTSNYIARKYGVRSAMATVTALKLCPKLILLPVNMQKYRRVAQNIHAIFNEFTDKVEPLSLDEAYLDVSEVPHYHGSATLIAQAIRKKIWETEELTASAGVAPNKLLAKIASGYKKPNGLFVIRPEEINAFIIDLPITELFGVGKKTAMKLQEFGFNYCRDLQRVSLNYLIQHFGKLGLQLYNQCRGIDHRIVDANRIRKSLSVERTFPQDIPNLHACQDIIQSLYKDLKIRLNNSAITHPIKNQFIKIKYSNFKQSTAEIISDKLYFERFEYLFQSAYQQDQAIRLLGMGVHFATHKSVSTQQSLFVEESFQT